MRPGVLDCGCLWDGKMLHVVKGCGPDRHADELGANFPYFVSVPPREGSDGPEGFCWTVRMHGDIVGPIRDDIVFNWTAPDYDHSKWPDVNGRWIWGDDGDKTT